MRLRGRLAEIQIAETWAIYITDSCQNCDKMETTAWIGGRSAFARLLEMDTAPHDGLERLEPDSMSGQIGRSNWHHFIQRGK
ncbi:MAG TPA: hypothetical protein VFY06_00760 [Verrucomicrobiae bacterium]|nr:hypothetical protein [Verrucomicrobiae bacterium]